MIASRQCWGGWQRAAVKRRSRSSRSSTYKCYNSFPGTTESVSRRLSGTRKTFVVLMISFLVLIIRALRGMAVGGGAGGALGAAGALATTLKRFSGTKKSVS